MRQRMRTPRAAAIAGILFSLLLMSSLSLMWISVPVDPLAGDVIKNSRRISFALDLLPFAGIAFLWFIGVLRDRFGEMEDRFFATVFLGSGLLFVSMVFTAAAVTGGIVKVLGEGSETLIRSGAYALARIQVSQTMGVYAAKMAGVFMITTSTISLRTRIAPRWMAFLGYALALVLLLLGPGFTQWIPLVFPLWVLLISTYILIDNVLRTSPAGGG